MMKRAIRFVDRLRVLPLLAAAVASWTGSAEAETINGVSYIQPTSVTTVGARNTSAEDQQPHGTLNSLIDGAGINLGTGEESTNTANQTVLYFGQGGIVFDLGAYYSLSSMRVWNLNAITYGGGSSQIPTRDVWVSTAISISTTTDGSGRWVFSAPVDTIDGGGPNGKFTLDDHSTVSGSYTGVTYTLTTTGYARYVLFGFRYGLAESDGNNWEHGRNDKNYVELAEVRFRQAGATPVVWSSTATGNWGSPGNWSGSLLPGTTNTAVFNGTDTVPAVTLDIGRSVQSITFDTASARAYTVGTGGGPALTLSSNGIIQTAGAVTNVQAVNAPLVLAGTGGSYTFASGANSSAATLTIGGSVTGGGSGGTTTLTLMGPTPGLISGNIGNGSSAALALVNLGTWTLSGANTYTGGTTVTSGILSITSTGALPGWDTGGRYSVAGGAGLAVGNSVSDGDVTTILGTGNFASGGLFGFDTTAGNRTYATALNGSIGLAKLGTNTLTLTGVNTYSGATTISGGTLEIGGAGQLGSGSYSAGITIAGGATFRHNSSASQTLSGLINGDGRLLKTGSGTLNIRAVESGTTLPYGGGTIVSGGVVDVRGELDLSGNAENRGIIRGALTIHAGATVTTSISGDRNCVFGWQNDGVTTVDINGGTLDIAHNHLENVGFSAITMTAGTLSCSGGSSAYFHFTRENAGGVSFVVQASSNSSVISANIKSIGGQGYGTDPSSFPFTVADGPAAIDLLFSGQMTHAIPVTKSGAGLMVLTGTNTYTSTTTVSNGTLLVNGSITGTGAVTVKSGATLGGAGSIAGVVTVESGGHLAPGGVNTNGTLTLTAASLNFNSGAILDCQIGGTSLNPTNDIVDLTGANSTVTFGANATVNLSRAPGATVVPNDKTFVMFKYKSSVPPAMPTWTFNYGGLSWRDGQVSIGTDAYTNCIVLTVVQPAKGTLLSVR